MSTTPSGTPLRRPYGWASTVGDFLAVSIHDWVGSLSDHYVALTHEAPGAGQVGAWRDEWKVLQAALSDIGTGAEQWGLAAEYELPFEGGRRPDIVLLAGSAVVVLEFKGAPRIERAHIDQVQAYSRDLAEYHEASHGLASVAVVVATNPAAMGDTDGVLVISTDGLADLLRIAAPAGGSPQIDLEKWLAAPYAPLPTLVAAARRIFRHEKLPHVRRAAALGLPEVVERVHALAKEAQDSSARCLALVTGVPGAGKTLVGLRVVYEHGDEARADATFLSGNGPLVKVLQDALGSGVFVRDLHKFVTAYGLSSQVPEQRVIVFDEAQRAWDAAYMAHHGRGNVSEPDILVSVADRIPGWAVLIGLVGEGQEIHSGEESGLTQWRDAIARSPHAADWRICCPPAVASVFDPLPVSVEPRLALTVSVRSRKAEMLHDWVRHLLSGDLGKARTVAGRVIDEGFPIYVTRRLEDAKTHTRKRYEGEPDARYGILVSSHAKRLDQWGIDNSFMATSQTFNVAKWFNAPREDPKSCCAMEQVATEFGCQGLELDLPIVCWGNDVRWDGTGWSLTPIQRRYPQQDPGALLLNTYRVLLTRGRDGLVVFVPPDRTYEPTADALVRGGVVPLKAGR